MSMEKSNEIKCSGMELYKTNPLRKWFKKLELKELGPNLT
jgi:hypothetical protein